MRNVSPCPTCESSNLYTSEKAVSSGGGYAPNYLPGLGPALRSARLDIIVCADCGHMRYFASEEARAKLSQSSKWRRVY